MRSAAFSRNSGKKCICGCASAIVLIVALILVLVFVCFTKRPRVTIGSVSPKDLDLSLFPPHLKVSLGLAISVTNRYIVGFEYTKSTALLKYRGKEFSEVTVAVPDGESGKIGARGTRNLTLTLTLELHAGSLFSNPALYKDAESGTLRLETYVATQGKVLSIHVGAHATCNLSINFSSRNVTCSL